MAEKKRKSVDKLQHSAVKKRVKSTPIGREWARIPLQVYVMSEISIHDEEEGPRILLWLELLALVYSSPNTGASPFIMM